MSIIYNQVILVLALIYNLSYGKITHKICCLVPNLEKIEVLDKKHNQVFLDEIIKIFKILLSSKSKLSKYVEMKNLLKRMKKIFKGVNGVGMSYYVGYKIK